MTLGKRKPRQSSLWVDARHFQAHAAHPCYHRLDEILQRAKFDLSMERLGRKFYAPTMSRPSLAPEICFRCFLVVTSKGSTPSARSPTASRTGSACGSLWV